MRWRIISWTLTVYVQGTAASAVVPYQGRAIVRGGASFHAEVKGLYDAGVVRNIAEFYRNLVEGHCENETVARAVDGTLTAILVREAGLRLSIYHHTGDWTERAEFAAGVAERVGHPRVGVNFNLCHWLKLEGDEDWRPFLRNHADRIFAVTLNGATTTARDWADGLVQPLDQGDFDTRGLLETLAGTGYRGPVGLMCFAIPGDPHTHLSRSMKQWRVLHHD